MCRRGSGGSLGLRTTILFPGGTQQLGLEFDVNDHRVVVLDFRPLADGR